MYLATGPYGKIIPMAPVSLIVVGAGQRGTGYARWVRRHPDRASVVAVAEPSPARRARLAAEHGITPENAVTDWTELAGRGRLADAVLICTQDRMHAEPAEAFAALGYHILLEKPMAPDEAGCRRIVAAVEKAGVMLAVGHVMRYTPYTRAVKQIADSGQLGDIMSVQHLEPVGFWHQAHSYVRGNWRRSDLATSMLMAKSCHDLDWLQYILGRAPLRVSSFGSLTHFTAANRPPGAADRCVACPVEPRLPLFGAAALPRPARPGRARLAAERRHRRLLSRRPGRGAGHRPVRPVRLRLRQRRRRPPGRRAGVSRRDHGHLHHDRVHPGRPPPHPAVRHPRPNWPATARPSASTTSSPAPSGRSPRRPRAG